MRTVRAFAGLSLLVLASCGGEPPPPPVAAPPPPALAKAPPVTAPPPAPKADANAAFAALGARFLETLLARRPDVATLLGEHRYDGRWPDLSEAGSAKERELYVSTDRALAEIDTAALSAEARVDHAILKNQIALALFSFDEQRAFETSPLEWTSLLGDGLDPLLSREYAPLETRLSALASRLEGIAPIVAAAKARLKEPARVHTETAIQQNKGLIELVTSGLDEHLKKAPGERPKVEAAAKKARAALVEFQGFLEKDLLARSRGDFRLGKERFEKKLRLVVDDPELSADELASGARALLDETREAMVETATQVWPLVMGKAPLPKRGTPAEKRAFVKQVLDLIAKDRPTNATIVSEASAMLSETTSFVREHDLVRVPDETARVIEMPEYRRGVSIAYCDSTGPLEKKQESFYAIAPTPKDWPAARVTSFFREYNRSMLRDLTIHEAMPGHFLQAMHQNRFKSDIRAVYSSGPFVEGWAVYGEWVMAKHGFGGPKVVLTRQKMALRMAANTILDHEIHAGQMDEKAALTLMKDDAFQEEGEAVGKWRRARLTSAQLSTYYYGFREMMRMRLAAEKKPGFTERTYHDALLSHGAPPMRHARTLVLGDTK